MGAQVSGTKRALEVFTSQPRPSASHDAVSLETLHSLNPKPSQATLRTREKIGLGEKIKNRSFMITLHMMVKQFLFFFSIRLKVL